MTIVELTGGFGNQLFQYAVGYAVAQRNGGPLRLNITHYNHLDPNDPHRPYQLWRLNISARTISLWDRVRLSHSFPVNYEGRPGRLLRRGPLRRLPLEPFCHLRDKAQGYQPEILEPNKLDTYLTGCWQTEKFFVDCRTHLLEEFSFRTEPSPRNRELIDKMKAAPSVSVHIRRGDYLRADTLTRPCSPDYYARAFEWFRSRVPNARYFVFSDEPDWVKENMALPPDYTLVTHNLGVDDGEDLRLMSNCDHFIIANSTFSWWGAWLSQSPGKQVVAPSVWYPQPHGSEKDLVPESWVRL